MARVRQAMPCQARRSDGEPCQAFAMFGAEVCRVHGGKAPQVQRKARERVIEGKALAVAEKYAAGTVDLGNPLDALLKLTGEIVNFKDFMARRVEELRSEEWRYGGLGGEQLRAEVAVYERAMDRAGRFLVDVNRLNLEERRVRLAEREGELLAGVIRAILDRLDLTPPQRALVGTVVPEELRRVDALVSEGRS